MVSAEYNLYPEPRLQLRRPEQIPSPSILGRVFPPPQTTEQFPPQRNHTETQLPVSAVYPAYEDLRFLHDHKEGMTDFQSAHYLRENIVAFLEEFAGKVPLKRVNGLSLPNELQVGGFDMLEAGEKAVRYKQRANMDASREVAELAGLRRMHRMFQDTDSKGAVWVSPPDKADYQMIFGFQVGDYDAELGGRPVSEYIFRISERHGDIAQSKHFYQKFHRLADEEPKTQIHKAEDILRDPIPLKAGLGINSIAKLIGITDADVRYSHDYGNAVRSLLAPLIDEYIQVVHKYDFLNVGDVTQAHLRSQFQEDAQPRIEKMFSMGVQIQRLLQGKLSRGEEMNMMRLIQGFHSMSHQPASQAAYIDAYANKLPPEVIQGGTQCPSWNSGSKLGRGIDGLITDGFGITKSMDVMAQLGADNIVYKDGKKHLLCFCPMPGCPSSMKSPREKVLAPIVDKTITCPCCNRKEKYVC